MAKVADSINNDNYVQIPATVKDVVFKIEKYENIMIVTKGNMEKAIMKNLVAKGFMVTV